MFRSFIESMDGISQVNECFLSLRVLQLPMQVKSKQSTNNLEFLWGNRINMCQTHHNLCPHFCSMGDSSIINISLCTRIQNTQNDNDSLKLKADHKLYCVVLSDSYASYQNHFRLAIFTSSYTQFQTYSISSLKNTLCINGQLASKYKV